ncbi:MAG: LysM peptidoglycan-binding domain-containing protein [Rhizobiaceae bacterium]
MMAITPAKILLFLAGASGAATGTAYMAGAFDPYLPPAAVATLPPANGQADPAKSPAADAQAPQPADAAKPAESAAEPAKPEEQKVAVADPQPEKPKADVATPGPTPPTFDLLRVEPDGSIVIAGKAAPGATVEIITGSKTLAKVEAGPAGDFVAVLDEPLKPGDYQIVLRATQPGTIVVNSVETAVVSVPEKPDGQVLALVEQPGAPSKLITAPAGKPDPTKPADVAAAPASPDAPKTGEQVAAAPADQPATPPVALGEAIAVSVEAVEIDGRKVFVAGGAPAGSTVRIYANDLLLGDAKSSPEGRFLLEIERDLKVGDYIIRADVLSPDGAKVLARAAVPFEREPGESIAAVAPTEPQPAVPAGEQPTAPAGEQPKPADQAAAPAQPADSKAPKVQDQAAMPPPAAGQAAAPTEPKPADAASPDASQPPAVAANDPAQPPAADATAPKLQPSAGGVIIRRGDTLWRISKRVYGRGTRYSTIYVANQDQIRDPDRIWPGQVFRVPDKSDRGENADMKAIEGQMTTIQ